ncbi:MAG: hypothetical protein OEW18_00245 [Candidatus Aminicenantes bacterium]|nr:hypothetical protein [Candidatus Aminicenantes bacterium]
MIRKVCEANSLLCSRCGGRMKVIAFLTNHVVVDLMIDYLKPTFTAQRSPLPQDAFQEYLWAADPPIDYFCRIFLLPKGEVRVISAASAVATGDLAARPGPPAFLDIL